MGHADVLTGRPAPEWRVPEWLANVDGAEGLSLATITEPIVYLYNFQSWCEGCHTHGFPRMKAVKAHLEASGRSELVKFVAVQTVFEGHETNTAMAAIESMARHDLHDIALGHDSGLPPTIMADYGTGGTPWTVIIGPAPERLVLTDGFHVDPAVAVHLIEEQLSGLQPKSAAPPDSPTEDTP